MKTNMSTKTLTLCTAMALGVALALPVRLSAQTTTTFDAPGAGTGFFQGTFVNSMNPEGVIAGYYTDAGNETHGFLRATDGTITTFDPPGSTFTNAGSINPLGTIAGYYSDTSMVHGFLRTKDGTITAFEPGSAWSNLFAPSDNNNQLPIAISSIGNAIAGYYYDAGFAAHGFLRSK